MATSPDSAGAGGLSLILGGTRSGKSSVARRRAREADRRVVFVATAVPKDEEMRRRVERHRAARPDGWRTLEPEHDLAALAGRFGGRDDRLVLCDELSLTVARWVHREGREASAVLERIDTWVDRVREGQTPWVVVSALVGRGIVPEAASARRFRDVLGRVNQRVADRADRVTEVIAGLTRELKPSEGAS